MMGLTHGFGLRVPTDVIYHPLTRLKSQLRGSRAVRLQIFLLGVLDACQLEVTRPTKESFSSSLQTDLLSFSDLRELINKANIFPGEVKSNMLAYHLKICREEGWVEQGWRTYAEVRALTQDPGQKRYSYYQITEKGRAQLQSQAGLNSFEIQDKVQLFRGNFLGRAIASGVGEDFSLGLWEAVVKAVEVLLDPAQSPEMGAEKLWDALTELISRVSSYTPP